MSFLFKNFEIFLTVYAAVALDTILGVADARTKGTFCWKQLPECLNTCLRYTLYMLFGNVADHFASLTSLAVEGGGLYTIALVLLAVEGASLKESILSLKRGDK